MKYLVVGAGGTGGAIGGFLARAGKNVTLIARGAHLSGILEKGLRVETTEGAFTVPVDAYTMEDYADSPDVIFVCVKGYSLADTVPFIRRVAGAHTVVIPLLNIYGTGRQLQPQLPDLTVTDGCMYIISEIKNPGTIRMSGDLFRVVYGLRRDTDAAAAARLMPVLQQIEADLTWAGIKTVLSDFVERDTMQKFSFISPMAAVGAAYDVPAAAYQEPGEIRDTFAALVREIKVLSEAMGVGLPEDIADINLKIMDNLAPTSTASVQRDIKKGGASEIDGLVYQVLRSAKAYSVELPVYTKIARRLRGLAD